LYTHGKFFSTGIGCWELVIFFEYPNVSSYNSATKSTQKFILTRAVANIAAFVFSLFLLFAVLYVSLLRNNNYRRRNLASRRREIKSRGKSRRRGNDIESFPGTQPESSEMVRAHVDTTSTLAMVFSSLHCLLFVDALLSLGLSSWGLALYFKEGNDVQIEAFVDVSRYFKTVLLN
jgi:hypothetical protein